jgi:hypothetical protein
MKRLSVCSFAAIFIFVLAGGVALATPIPTLFSTGVDDTSAVLGGGSTDPHYTLISGPTSFSGTTPPSPLIYPLSPVVSSPINPSWALNNTVSQWISPIADANPLTFQYPESNTLPYTYRTTFDLTGFIPTSVVITGMWMSDNQGVDILLNGVSTGISHFPADGNPALNTFQEWSNFTISSGFVPGMNTLAFEVLNFDIPGTFGNPSGLRVELSGDATAIPEPSTMLLLATGLVGLAGFRRKFRR